jgi:hypothetical protein
MEGSEVLDGGVPAECFAGPVVEFGGDRREVSRGG